MNRPMPELNYKTGPDTVRVVKGEHSLEFEVRGPRGGVRYLTVPGAALPQLAALLDQPRSPEIGALTAAGETLADLLDDAIGTHIYDLGGGDEQPEDCPYQEAVEAWRRVSNPQLAGDAPIRVLVALEGGMVQGAVADRKGVAVTVLDYDTEGADADSVFAIPQDSGGTAEAIVGGHSALHDPAFIDRAEAAKLASEATA